ncbi:hypothetical protein H1R20_g15242, partial [Candolleomyces eurysporus]
MPPNSRKAGVLSRLSWLVKGRSGKPAIEPSQHVAEIVSTGAGPLPLHDPSIPSIPSTPANNPTPSSIQGSISQLSKHPSTDGSKRLEPESSTANATIPAASTSTPAAPNHIPESLLHPSASGSTFPGWIDIYV